MSRRGVLDFIGRRSGDDRVERIGVFFLYRDKGANSIQGPGRSVRGLSENKGEGMKSSKVVKVVV
jgi:hypothetical protein